VVQAAASEQSDRGVTPGTGEDRDGALSPASAIAQPDPKASCASGSGFRSGGVQGARLVRARPQLQRMPCRGCEVQETSPFAVAVVVPSVTASVTECLPADE
jgi:hypothetical protein